jgi:hypothetical protein
MFRSSLLAAAALLVAAPAFATGTQTPASGGAVQHSRPAAVAPASTTGTPAAQGQQARPATPAVQGAASQPANGQRPAAQGSGSVSGGTTTPAAPARTN